MIWIYLPEKELSSNKKLLRDSFCSCKWKKIWNERILAQNPLGTYECGETKITSSNSEFIKRLKWRKKSVLYRRLPYYVKSVNSVPTKTELENFASNHGIFNVHNVY